MEARHRNTKDNIPEKRQKKFPEVPGSVGIGGHGGELFLPFEKTDKASLDGDIFLIE